MFDRVGCGLGCTPRSPFMCLAPLCPPSPGLGVRGGGGGKTVPSAWLHSYMRNHRSWGARLRSTRRAIWAANPAPRCSPNNTWGRPGWVGPLRQTRMGGPLPPDSGRPWPGRWAGLATATLPYTLYMWGTCVSDLRGGMVNKFKLQMMFSLKPCIQL